ncbi:MAG: hypothetical protein GX552_15940 [Chloroflexi bacterium]|jgi:hypothetical protein|nr:hypothetical protein [Chloroflexota bacterium]
MSMQQEQVQASKQEQRRARQALAAFLRRLQRVCERAREVEEHNDLVDRLNALLREHGHAIPVVYQQRMQKAASVGDAGRAAMRFSCKALQAEVANAINALPATAGVVAPILVGLALISTLFIGGSAVNANANAVEVVVVNNGCAPLRYYPRVYSAIDKVIELAGVKTVPIKIPVKEIETLRLPKGKITLDATEPDRLVIGFRGRKLPLDIAGVDRIEWDGVPQQMGQLATVEVGALPQHELVLGCQE